MENKLIKQLRNIPTRWIKIMGVLLTVACLFFIGKQLHSYFDDISQLRFSMKFIPIAVFGLLILVVNQFLIPSILLHIYKYFGVDVASNTIFHSVMKPQIAKYLPGNIFHLGGTISLLKKSGIDLRSSFLGLFLQHGLLIIISLFISLPALFNFSNATIISIFLIFVLPIMILLLVRTLNSVRNEKLQWVKRFTPTGRSSHLFFTVLFSLLFFLNSALSLTIMQSLLPEQLHFQYFDYLVAFSLSWVAGLLVLGSPGGLGVREVAFVLLLPVGSKISDVTLLIVFQRILWVISDLAAFILAPQATRRKPNQK